MKKRDDWYLPDSETLTPLGPFSYDQIVEQLRKRQLHFDDFVWHTSFTVDHWVRLIDLPDFEDFMRLYPKCPLPKKMSRGNLNIRKLKIEYSEELADLAKENEFRRYPRAPLKAKCLLHNNQTFVEGMALDISETGMFIVVERLEVFPMGEEVSITVMDHPRLQTFTIKSVIINSRLKDGSQGYGTYFLHMNPLVRRRIVDYVVKSLTGPFQRQEQAA